jgi:hypothetical protein
MHIPVHVPLKFLSSNFDFFFFLKYTITVQLAISLSIKHFLMNFQPLFLIYIGFLLKTHCFLIIYLKFKAIPPWLGFPNKPPINISYHSAVMSINCTVRSKKWTWNYCGYRMRRRRDARVMFDITVAHVSCVLHVLANCCLSEMQANHNQNSLNIAK